MKITNTVTKEFDVLTVGNHSVKETVIAEISNTSTAFRWRLRIEEYSTGWTSHYIGILAIRSHKTDRLYCYLTDYWCGQGLPTEEPFMITKGK